jgi:hypothetical protein
LAIKVVSLIVGRLATAESSHPLQITATHDVVIGSYAGNIGKRMT